MKKILVTGGAGFVGSHLCKRLLDEGNEVICLDNLYTGRRENIEMLEAHPNFSFVMHDIVDPYDAEVDEIYNLACPASPPHYQKDPLYTMKISFFGALNMLELAKKYDAKILQASTSEVYGDPAVHPQSESYWWNVNPIGIRSCYDEWKRAAETLFFDYYRAYSTKIRVIRIFNTYGPNMDPEDGRVVSNFIMQALKNEQITIYWDGSQTRSFQFVSDLVDGMITMMNNDSDFVWPVNLGTQFEFTIKELAEKVLQLVPESTSTIVYRDLPMDDPKLRKADNSLAKNMLGRSPEIDLVSGLKKTIPYFQWLL